MERVAIRQLRDGLTTFLRRVRAGESLLITDRNTPIAQLTPVAPGHASLAGLVAQGWVDWGGGKPRGAARPARVREGRVSDLVVEARR
ncbi:type II toxin-antitoxin system prevent-host-death family antitoxin [Carboxydochorda subterranea]|uniref:Type II toxin-antitoxin system prevent-host-death family antitoxin n=1 Tax=Carboxydichorda subterranea TaxID=3109565 RepID=A0ABZ1BYR5_9FIRM|nr:type II toxin-antitoxin system prevent-host-death family antitoxin [Limnochorda sp. L945t]WRP17212.1 type II toxin-antitoxin system prevent-host-death family antitoxin [Limnochorda sp. L945t]